jgi:hypothetical protein
MMNISEDDYVKLFSHDRPIITIERWQQGFTGTPLTMRGILMSPPHDKTVVVQIQGRGLCRFNEGDGYEKRSGRDLQYQPEGGLKIRDLTQIHPPAKPTPAESIFWFGK